MTLDDLESTLNGVTALILRLFADFDFFAGQIRRSG